MSIQERLNDLFSKGCSAITFTSHGGQEIEKPKSMVAATHVANHNDWHSKTTIEAIGSSHADALNTLAEKIDHLSKFDSKAEKPTSNIIHVPHSN
jgi:hypothetical protein